MLDVVRKYFSPFGLFQDASRGSFAEKAAAFRHNCHIRGCLLTYISRWMWSGCVAFLLTGFFDSMGSDTGDLTIFVILAATVAVFTTLATCAIFVLSYSYFTLAYHAAQMRDASPRR